ncbi:MAG: TIGR01777 family oxidoreductase [Kiritimatiellae bacterium]|nr:TIGR01777 family oxidoreductase [Kiritimatiellia bacterium]
MNVLITGASGFLGRPLISHMHEQGHTAVPLARGDASTPPNWNPATGDIDLSGCPPIDAVVHLAGESVAGGWWTKARKSRILRSRVDGTRLLAETLASMPTKPRALICASGISYYGSRGEALMDESQSPGEGFLADVTQQWEAAAAPARDAGIRVVHARFSMVLAPHGGALAKMLPPFRLGLGGNMGNGKQYYSWISLHDAVRALYCGLTDESICGPVNIASPEPVTNRDFTKALGRAVKRPTCMHLPTGLARLLLGEMADELLLAGQRAVPAVLQQSGFTFDDPTLDSALKRMSLP